MSAPGDVEAMRDAHHKAIHAYWSSIGNTNNDLLAYCINPQFLGAPPWPNMRQAYRIVRTPKTLILASDGLSDVVAKNGRFGLGMEVCIEVKGLQDLAFDEIKDHWVLSAIENMAGNVADMGGILPRLEQCGMLSIELPIGRGPVGWLAGNGNVGALVGAPMHEPSGEPRGAWVQDTPIRPVKIVPITILRIPEIDACAAGGTPARRALAYDLLAAGHGHITDLSRPSLR